MKGEKTITFRDYFMRKIPYELIKLIDERKENFILQRVCEREGLCTNSVAYKIMNRFEILGLIERKRTGRVNVVTLTPKGQEVLAILRKIDGGLR